MKISLTIKALIVSIILLIVSISVYVVLFSIIREDNQTISEIQGKINSALRREQQLQSAQLLVRDIMNEGDELNSLFIPSDGVVAFLETIESLNRTTGALIEVETVDLEQVSFLETEKEKEFVEFLKMNISVEGSWREVFYAISLIENMPLGSTVHQMSLEETRGSSRGWTGLMDISFAKLK